MEENEKRSNLPSLPPSNDKFWKNAVKYKTDTTYKTCEHVFSRKGVEVFCKKCNAGWFDYTYQFPAKIE